MTVAGQHALSFLLRLWKEMQDGRQTWRASLEDPHTGERRGFTGLDPLVEFLRERTREENDLPGTPGERRWRIPDKTRP